MADAVPGAPASPDEGRAVALDGRADDDDDLRASLAGLSRLGMGQGRGGLEEMLRHVAAFAVGAIPGADGAGVTMLEEGRADTIVASGDFAREVDAIQYGLGEGPGITAAAEGRTVTSGGLYGEKVWPRFGPRVARLGVNSVLSLPLVGSEGVLGAMNVYARAEQAFDDRAVELGELFAVPAAISVQNALALTQARRLARRLQAALTSRTMIDHALGIVMSRAGCAPDEAFAKVRVVSQAENRKVSAVAQSIVDEAVSRARARHAVG